MTDNDFITLSESVTAEIFERPIILNEPPGNPQAFRYVAG
jgi:hypothetical protein